MEEKVYTTSSPQETQHLGEKVALSLKNGGVIALYGDLGTGKTTFVQGLAKGLGITKRIISPTFIIVRTYKINAKYFYHVDLYRVHDEDNIKGLGIQEIINNSQNIVAIEWAQKLGNLLPQKRIDLRFENKTLDKRKIVFNKSP